MIDIDEYTLYLSTGEVIPFTELCLDRNPSLRDLLSSYPDAFAKIPIIPEIIMNEAKKGYDRPIFKYFKGPPISGLIRLNEKECYQRKACSSRSEKCVISDRLMKMPVLPVCFEYSSSDDLIRPIMTEAIKSWISGRTFIITT